jgi:hypothetical protein
VAARLWRRLWITRDQLEAAAAGAELVELELEPLDGVEPDFSDFSDDEDEVLVDSELLEEPLDVLAELLAESRLSLR